MIWRVQLVFDCADPDEIMAFWGPKLGYKGEHVGKTPAELREFRKDFPQFDGRGRLDDTEARRMPIYIQKVPESKQGRNRLRLEVASPAGDGCEKQDVEGNEFTEVQGTDVVLKTIVFDVLDPDRQLEFWSEATGYEVSDGRCDPKPGQARVEGGHLVVNGEQIPDLRASWSLGFTNPNEIDDRVVLDLIPGIAFTRVDEPKRAKNRLHLDLGTQDREGDVERLLKLGATVQRKDDGYTVMQDPEGNEFCVG